jgi:hypothetical protein
MSRDEVPVEIYDRLEDIRRYANEAVDLVRENNAELRKLLVDLGGAPPKPNLALVRDEEADDA